MKNNLTACSNENACSVCGGSGWIIEKTEVSDIYPTKKEIDVARPCPSCRNRARVSGDMPNEFYNANLQNFDWTLYDGKDMSDMQAFCESVVSDFSEWQKHGQGLYFYSKISGCGKTRLLCSIGNMLSTKHNVKFITAPEYLGLIKRGFKQYGGEINAENDYKNYYDAEILILDDIGAEKSTDWTASEFFRLIDHRNNLGLVTFYSSNVEPNDLKFSGRTISRIYDKSVVLQMPEISVRATKGKAKQKAFIQHALRKKGMVANE